MTASKTGVSHAQKHRREARPWRSMLVALAVTTSVAHAFDPKGMHDGLFYNATNVNEQLWTPLVLVRKGEMIDPFELAKREGLTPLQGQGKTELLHAVTPVLYGGCGTNASLMLVPALIAAVPAVSVQKFTGRHCGVKQETALNNFREAPMLNGDDPFPKFLLSQPRVQMAEPLWVVGVPGRLVGDEVPIVPRSESQLGRRPEAINGLISRLAFLTQPVIEPDEAFIASVNKEREREYPVGLSEAVHRGDRILVGATLLKERDTLLRARIVGKYQVAIRNALGRRFGGIEREFAELGLVQGIDIDNTTSFDYVGVVRVGAITKNGPWRWIDVAWVWRKGLGQSADALSILRTSEPELMNPANGYFNTKNPSIWPPTLVVSGISDLDKDKLLEVITSVQRPVAVAYDRKSRQAGGSFAIDLRDSAIHAWTPKVPGSPQGAWQEVYRTSVHEARRVSLDPTEIKIEKFGE